MVAKRLVVGGVAYHYPFLMEEKRCTGEGSRRPAEWGSLRDFCAGAPSITGQSAVRSFRSGQRWRKSNVLWWKRRSASEQSRTVDAIFGVLSCIILAMSIGVVTSNHVPYDVNEDTVKGKQTDCRESGNDDVCVSQECIHTASSILNSMDPNVDPCDDFYRFACGGFLNSTFIPDDESRVNSYSPIEVKMQDQLRITIESPIEPNDGKPFKLVKTLYKTCMNTTAIEDQGPEPLHKVLNNLGGWPVLDGELWNDTAFDWRQLIKKFIDTGYPVYNLMRFGIGKDPDNDEKNVIYFYYPSLGLNYKNLSHGVNDKSVETYYNFMVDIAVLLGTDRERASTELKDSLLFEIKLANLTKRYKPYAWKRNYFKRMTVAKLTETYSGIPWREVLINSMPKNMTIEENDIVVVKHPRFVSGFQKLMSVTPKRVLANYMMWTAVSTSLEYLNDDFRKRKLAYYAGPDDGLEQKPRWKQCIASVNKNLHFGVDAMYVREYFNREAKENASRIATNIRQQFIKKLQKAEWLDEITRHNALEKAATMKFNIGYPDELLDDDKLEEFYENLELPEGNYLESSLNLLDFKSRLFFNALRKPAKTSDWTSHGRTAQVRAYHIHKINSIYLAAGMLQGVIFSSDRPKYMNYGTIGFAIGHEILTAFDSQKKVFASDHNRVSSTLPTIEKFRKNAECINHQYGNYTDEKVELKLDGTRTESENIADNGAIKLAYFAYDDWVQHNEPEQKLPGLPYSTKQMFWISSANVWCAKYRPQYLKHVIRTNRRSPEKFTVVGSFSNMPEFSTDFNCPVGSKMNPEKKCSVW